MCIWRKIYYLSALSKVNKSTGESGLGFMAILYTEDKMNILSGIRMTFDKDGKAVSLGKAKSIVFDYKGSEASVGSSFVVKSSKVIFPTVPIMVRMLLFPIHMEQGKNTINTGSVIGQGVENLNCAIFH